MNFNNLRARFTSFVLLANLCHPAAAGSHLDVHLAVGRDTDNLVREIAGGPVGIGSVTENLHRPVSFTEEAEVEKELAGIPIGQGACVPGVTASAGD